MFDMAMTHFGSRVNAIQGNWFRGTNLDEFNAMTGRGATAADAAAATWTGRMAARHGFGAVRSVTAIGVSGAFTRVTALFGRT
jgi:hypothetical protein